MLTKRDSGLHEWTCTFSELLIWILETFFPLQQFVRTLSMRSNYFVMFTSPFLNICLWVKTIDYASCHVSFWSLHLGFSNKLSQISHGLVHSTKNSAKKKKGEQKVSLSIDTCSMYIQIHVQCGGYGLKKMVQNRTVGKLKTVPVWS